MPRGDVSLKCELELADASPVPPIAKHLADWRSACGKRHSPIVDPREPAALTSQVMDEGSAARHPKLRCKDLRDYEHWSSAAPAGSVLGPQSFSPSAERRL